MLGLKIDDKQLKKVQLAFQSMPEEITREMIRTTRKVGLFAVGEVKMMISGRGSMEPAVRTGAMMRGIQVSELAPLRVVIRPSTATPYAWVVHDGKGYGRNSVARPFFDLTAEESGEKIQEFYTEALNNAVARVLNRTK